MADVVVDTLKNIGVVDTQVNIIKRNDSEKDEQNINIKPLDGTATKGNGKEVCFECVDLENGDGDDEEDDGLDENIKKKKRLKKKKPKHIHIEGDTSSDEESSSVSSMDVDPSDLTWLLWTWYYITAASSGALKAAEYLGEKLAAFFGITTPKYQYVIDEYYRLKEIEREEEEREQKEKEFLAARKMEDLSRMEGGDASPEPRKP